MRRLEVCEPLYVFDAEQRQQWPVFCGIDEAGRGPLAGDVYAAAVILPPALRIPGLNDSKKLSEARREALYTEICAQATAYAVASASVAEIEQLNILQAALLAMRRAYRMLLEQVPQETLFGALIDGNRPAGLPSERCVIGGDAKSASIAAASVLAKVTRDRTMLEADAQFPQYGFAKHKGYGTKAHTDAILEYGPCPLHRPSFLKKLYEKQT